MSKKINEEIDLSTAILNSKTKNSVLVTDEFSDSLKVYQIGLSPQIIDELELFADDYILVKGKKRSEVVFTIVPIKELPKTKISMKKEERINLKVRINDIVKLYPVINLPAIKSLNFLPIADTVKNIEGDMFDDFISPFFEDAYKPLSEGSRYIIASGLGKIEYKVVSMVSESGENIRHGFVVKDTEVFYKEEITREEAIEDFNMIGYDDIGGCRRQLAQIKELIELPLRHPQLYERLGVKPPKGILLYGPPGTGKTLIARAISNETGAFIYMINGPEIMSKMAGESENNLRKAFEEAAKNKPAIIFMDEIDSIAPKRDKTHGEVEKRIVSQLLTLMDGIKGRDGVIVLAATNRPNAIDPALRRFGRFDKEIEISIPDSTGRLEVLRVHTKNMRLASDVDLAEISDQTHGFSGSDIASLCAEAALQQIREKLPYIDLDSDKIDASVLASLKVTRDNFIFAINKINPSTLRENSIERPDVKWSDIGGLVPIKEELIESIQYPISHSDKYIKFGMNPPKGILFYGPPGCGKTLLAKAVANECNANFISVKGPELLSMWFGESESNIRDLFDKARAAAPCVIFFDEIDSVATSRGSSSNDNGVSDRILNQLLIEMDGINAKKSVFVIGATNRPDKLDTALTRPGRLDQLIYIPLPDVESRESILKANLKKTPLSPEIDISIIAKKTSGFSGADLVEICQIARKAAIRDSIKHGEKNTSKDSNLMDIEDPVPFLTTEHFMKALSQARRSVTEKEIQSYEAFARSMKVDIRKFTRPEENNAADDGGLYD